MNKIISINYFLCIALFPVNKSILEIFVRTVLCYGTLNSVKKYEIKFACLSQFQYITEKKNYYQDISTSYDSLIFSLENIFT